MTTATANLNTDVAEAPTSVVEAAEPASAAQDLDLVAAEEPLAAETPEPAASSELEQVKAQLRELEKRVAGMAAAEMVEGVVAKTEELSRQLSAVRDSQATQMADEEAREALAGLREELASTSGLARSLASDRHEAGLAAREFDPTTVPPVVLEQAYSQVLNEVFQEIVRRLGESAAVNGVERHITTLRKANAGMEFFALVDNERVEVTGLAAAIPNRLISARQIQVAFDELLKALAGEVPGYRPRPLTDLVDSGSRAYSVRTASRLTEQAAELETAQRAVVDEVRELEARASKGEDDLKRLEQRTLGFAAELSAALMEAERIRKEHSRRGDRMAKLEQRFEEVEAQLALVGRQNSGGGGAGKITRRVSSGGYISVGGGRRYIGKKLAGVTVEVNQSDGKLEVYHDGNLVCTKPYTQGDRKEGGTATRTDRKKVGVR